jgi:hypothetical protein
MAELSMTALAGADLVAGIALTAASSGGGSLEGPGRADDRHPDASRSALCDARRFPAPCRVELEDMIVDLRELGPHEVVVQARRSVISAGTELAHYRGDSLLGLLPPVQRPHQPFHPGYAMAGTVRCAPVLTTGQFPPATCIPAKLANPEHAGALPGDRGRIIMWRDVSDDHALGEALTSLLGRAAEPASQQS